jgi:periplasmic protein CpxP/Spy
MMGNHGTVRRVGRAIPGIVAAIALVLVAAPARAQQGPPAGRGMPSVDDRVAQMTEQLNLTEEQQAKVRPILEKQVSQRQELLEKQAGDRETMRAEMRKLLEQGDEELAGVLTEEQMKRHVEQRQQWMRRGPPGRRPGGRPGGPSSR